MKKFNKLILVFKKYGLLGAFKKIYNYLNIHFFSKFNLFGYIYTMFTFKTLKKNINDIILQSNFDRIIIWRSSFGWDVPLFQRPQHISKNFSNNNCLV